MSGISFHASIIRFIDSRTILTLSNLLASKTAMQDGFCSTRLSPCSSANSASASAAAFLAAQSSPVSASRSEGTAVAAAPPPEAAEAAPMREMSAGLALNAELRRSLRRRGRRAWR
ncbi:Os06g0244901 [Oryza sativa Japonica Group]|uniref:Os06g0244901 protein n=1 Tax=Oryza sativa subsp. japonica TaxID=39947 RepID=A0A0P0WUJ9_ORYSJ|nr:hypothetical protein EE612_033061 [Oryza sativa]BAS97020.1 Os06g0244901 [Oryza sativa Japonica Group]